MAALLLCVFEMIYEHPQNHYCSLGDVKEGKSSILFSAGPLKLCITQTMTSLNRTLGLGTAEAKFKVQYFHKYSENTWLVCLVRRLEEHSEKRGKHGS